MGEKNPRILFLKESSNEFSYWQTEVSDYLGCRAEYDDFKDAQAFISVDDHDLEIRKRDKEIEMLRDKIPALIKALGCSDYVIQKAMKNLDTEIKNEVDGIK